MLGKLFYAFIAASQENSEMYLLFSDKATLANRTIFLNNNNRIQKIINLINGFINNNDSQNIDDISSFINEERLIEIENNKILQATTKNGEKVDLSLYTRNSKSGFSYHKLFINHKDLIFTLANKHNNDVVAVIQELSDEYKLPIFHDFGDNSTYIFKRQSNWSFKDDNPFSKKHK